MLQPTRLWAGRKMLLWVRSLPILKYPREVYVRVIDALIYGMSLNRVMQQLRDIAIAWFVPVNDPGIKDKDMAALQRKRTEHRQQLRLLTRTLKAMLDSDPDNKEIKKIKSELRYDEMILWFNNKEQKNNKILTDVETAGTYLAGWLDGKYMAFAVEAYLLL